MNEIKSTKKFILPSGVECEVSSLLGKHQRILTTQGKNGVVDNIDKVLTDVVERVGSQTHIDIKFIKNLLYVDKKKILVELRQFSCGEENKISFSYQYISSNGEEKSVDIQAQITGEFNTKSVKILKPNGKLENANYKEYKDIQKGIQIDLPKSKKRVTFYMLDGNMTDKAGKIPAIKRSANTAFEIRNVVEQRETNNGGKQDVMFNTDNALIPDLTFLRRKIKEIEGDVDTIVSFPHPEAEYKSEQEKVVKIDILSLVAFFFPSEILF